MSTADLQETGGDETATSEPVGETFVIDGETCELRTYPLVSYYTMSDLSWPFADWHWMSGRSYFGTWEITNQRLYLLALDGYLKAGDRATLASLFPEYPDRVFAHWFSGALEIPLNGVPGLDDTTRDPPALRRLTFQRGIVACDDEWRDRPGPVAPTMTRSPPRWRSLIDRCLGRGEGRS